MEIDEIKKFKEYQVNTRHSERLARQRTAQDFLEDKYDIPYVKDNHRIRSFSVSEMANGLTQQAIKSEPKIFTTPIKTAKETEDAADRVASLLNGWVKTLSSQSTNPFKSSFKTLAFARGESWIYTPHKSELVKDEKWRKDTPDIIPVHFIMYDPMVVFADPSEFVDGKPTRVVVTYKRMAGDLAANYPDWLAGKDNPSDKLVDFLLYIDKDQLYAEADGEALFREKNKKLANGDGRKKNIYGFINFAHAYTGWGYETEDNKPDLLAYDRIRMMQDKIIQDAIMSSAFSYNIINFAWRGRTLVNKSGREIGADAYKEYRPNEPGKMSEVTLAPGMDIIVEESQLFEAPVFAYRDRVKAELEASYPGSLKGQASGSSGRQEDILSTSGMAIYDSPIENLSKMWAEAFGNALKVCDSLKDVGLFPPALHEKDIDSFSRIEVKLQAENPLETLRLAADGDRKYQLGIIDDLTNLIDYQGKTKEEAKGIMARKLVDDVTRNDPVFRQIMGMALAEEMGMGDIFEQVQTGLNPTPQFGSQGGQPREANIKTPTGAEQIDMSQQRRPPRMPPGMGG